MTWQDYFTDIILERGWNYYKEGRVKIISQSSSKIKASVIGYHEYNVSIDFKSNECYCDCRYGGRCKHLAAAFYYLDNHPKSNDDYSDLLSKFSYERLVAFLKNELPQNHELLDKLKEFEKQDMNDEYYYRKLNESFKSPVNVIDFINEELMDLNNVELKVSLMNRIMDYLYELNDERMYDSYDNVFESIDRLIKKLLVDNEDKACEFLAYHIINTNDFGVCDYFSGIYDDYRDSEELFD